MFNLREINTFKEISAISICLDGSLITFSFSTLSNKFAKN